MYLCYKLPIFLIFSCFSILYGQETTTCFEEFTITENEAILISFDDIDNSTMSLVVQLSETVDVNSILYSISWNDPTTPETDNENDDNTALEFVDFTQEDTSLSVKLSKSMVGLVDYPNPTDILQLTFHFDFDDLADSPCKIVITHEIIDENTQEPHLELDLYWSYVREDFPIMFQIPDLQPWAYDLDATSPNNNFTVITSEGCPIEAMEPFYICEDGAPAYVTFQLTQRLDHDAEDAIIEYNCTISLMDFGTPSMMTNKGLITLFVDPYPDEDPAFTSIFYNGYLGESVAGAVVAVTPEIMAVDQDVPPRRITSYSMVPADVNVGGDEYFEMDSSTGEITVTEEIDNDFLAWEVVSFVLTACDEAAQCGNSFLSINLPLLSTNGSNSLYFEKEIYTTQIDSPKRFETVLQIHAQSGNNQEDVIYYFEQDASPGLLYFHVDAYTGEIITLQDNTPSGYYILNANAFEQEESMTARTVVNIEVVFQISNAVFLNESIVYVTINENEKTPLYQITGVGAFYFCTLDVRPAYFTSYITLDNETGLISSKSIDADTVSGNFITIKAAAYSVPTECVPTSIDETLLSNEMLIEVEISDSNDNLPYFLDPTGKSVNEIVFAYPQDVAMQRAIGPIAKVMGKDDDFTQKTLAYKLNHYSDFYVAGYDIDSTSGEIFLTTPEVKATKFFVEASDSEHFNSLIVNIEILDNSFISTMYLDYVSPSTIEDAVLQVSAHANVSIYILYTNWMKEEANASNPWMAEAQVYSTRDGKLINWQKLNETLVDAGFHIEVKSFNDEQTFVLEEDDSFKTATIVLGCLTGFLLIVLIVFYVHSRMKSKNGKQGKGKISTLGDAYANEEFRDDNNEPTFASIFGDNPVDGKVLRDSLRRASTPTNKKRSSTGSQKPSTSAEPYKSSESPGTSKTIAIISSPEEVTSVEIHQTQQKPPVEPSSDYDKEEDSVATRADPESDSKVEHEEENIQGASAPAVESESEGDSASNSDKKSNLKTPEFDQEPSEDEEQKSVAFKVLVDTKEFEPDNKL